MTDMCDRCEEMMTSDESNRRLNTDCYWKVLQRTFTKLSAAHKSISRQSEIW